MNEYRVTASVVLAGLLLAGCGKKAADQPQAANTGGPTQQPINPTPGSPPKAAPPAKLDPSKSEPSFALTAEEFAVQMSNTNTSGKYAGKVVDVTGVVKDFARSRNDKQINIRVWANKRVPVKCVPASGDLWTKCLPGQTVTLRGRVNAEFFDTSLDDCILAKAEPAPELPKITVDEQTDPVKLDAAYRDKWVYVSGTVVAKEKDRVMDYKVVVMKAAKGLRVECTFHGMAPDAPELPNAGDAVTLLAQYTGYLPAQKQLLFGSCVPIPRK